ncbi:MAG TPA: PP2C family protein-serine/threonine phosphatase [Kofleriaceae bacterium]|nr:PP2C family protein-serine/threonine phosphatase [Kofleriaceae bacterium]
MMGAELLVGITIAIALVIVWLAVMLARAGRRSSEADLGAMARDALVKFADRALELETVADILGSAREAAWRLFGCQRVVAFEPGTDRGTWDVFVPGGEILPAVPAGLRGPFGWFVHNRGVAARGELGDRRFGAMRAPLRELMERYEVDVLIPLVEHGRLLAVVGILLGRRPSELDGQVLLLYRLEVTAACANIKLHRQAAHVLTLAKEMDLASAVKLALVPDDVEGHVGPISWAGHYQAAGNAGSDFWGVYPIGGGRVLFLIGDAVGSGLAGSMVAAVVKSCCDAVYDAVPESEDGGPGPPELLAALSAALQRPATPTHARCFAALFDPAGQRILYANAGHTLPYRINFASGPQLGVLAGSGPLLGDPIDQAYRENRSPLGAREVFVLFTDGLIKARSREGEPFGERRLQRVLAAQKDASAREIRERILTSLAAYHDGGPLVDDIALVVVRCKV